MEDMKEEAGGGITHSGNTQGNTEHYAAGASGGKGGQFAPKNGAGSAGGAVESYDEIAKRQGWISRNKKSWNVIGNVTDYDGVTLGDLDKDTFSSLKDMTQATAVFKDLLADPLMDAMGYVRGTEVTNGKDDMLGADYVFEREDGGVDMLDLKSYMTGTKKSITLSVRKMFFHKGAPDGEWLDGWFMNDDLKTTHYGFMGYSHPDFADNLSRQVQAMRAARVKMEQDEGGWDPDGVMDDPEVAGLMREFVSGVSSASIDVLPKKKIRDVVRWATGKDDDYVRKQADFLRSLTAEADDGRIPPSMMPAFITTVSEAMGYARPMTCTYVGKTYRIKLPIGREELGLGMSLRLDVNKMTGKMECSLEMPLSLVKRIKGCVSVGK